MFTFKQFKIDDSACAMKVGTDGVLLGAWTDVSDSRTCLDIGTGSGLIALMLAQRTTDMTIDAIDIDSECVSQAEKNITSTPFRDRINVRHTDFRETQDEKRYDVIVSNPPFHKEDTGCPDDKRDKARHTTSLSFDELIKGAKDKLTDKGRFCVIIPADAATDFIGEAARHKLYLERRTDVKTTQRKLPKRVMLSFTRDASNQTQFSTLIIKDKNNEYSSDYRLLTKDFYLGF